MEVNENHTLLAYADDIIIMSDTKQDIANSPSNLMKACKYMGLSVNHEKTKYMHMTKNVPDDEDESDLVVDGYLFNKYRTLNILESTLITGTVCTIPGLRGRFLFGLLVTTYFINLPSARNTCPAHSNIFDHRKSCKLGPLYNMFFLLSYLPVLGLSIGSYTFLRIFLSNVIGLVSSPCVVDHVSHPYMTMGRS